MDHILKTKVETVKTGEEETRPNHVLSTKDILKIQKHKLKVKGENNAMQTSIRNI